jgi:hypothetical protein
MSMDFEIIERPTTFKAEDPLISAILETADTGKAIRIRIPENDTVLQMQARLRYACRDQGYAFAYRHIKGERVLVCWVLPQMDEE